MTGNISEKLRRSAPPKPGVQQPVTMVYNKRLRLLTGKIPTARLTGCYSNLIPMPFGHGKRSLSQSNPDNLSTNLKNSNVLIFI
jgi:hypothetical protein